MLKNNMKIVRVKVDQDKKYPSVPSIIITRGSANRYVKKYYLIDDREFERLRFDYWRTTLRHKFCRLIYRFK
jgi:hypothetical protein